LLLDELIVNDVPANIGTLIIIKVEVHVYTEGDLDCLGWVGIIFNLTKAQLIYLFHNFHRIFNKSISIVVKLDETG
jgi:hypothetical protein